MSYRFFLFQLEHIPNCFCLNYNLQTKIVDPREVAAIGQFQDVTEDETHFLVRQRFVAHMIKTIVHLDLIEDTNQSQTMQSIHGHFPQTSLMALAIMIQS